MSATVGGPETQYTMDLQHLALRMAREMPLKERIIHLQAFKYTFHGHQAVSYLVAAGIAPNDQAAVLTCQQLLQHALLKSIYHKDTFLPDNEVYRFPSALLDNNKHKGIPSLTSTGLYKEIAKFGKAAAQPFKDIQTSLNDTFATLGSLSAVAPKLSSMSSGAVGSPLGTRTHNSRLARSIRRSQSAKLEKQLSGVRSEVAQDSIISLVGELQAMHAAVKESTSLIRLDLQQHTALQEHLVGILRAQQGHLQSLQLLGCIIAASATLTVAASGGSWPVSLLGCIMLAVVLLVVLPNCFNISLWSLAVALRNPQCSAANDSSAACETMVRQSSRLTPALDTVSVQHSMAGQAGSPVGSDGGSDGEPGSDEEADWYEGGPCLEDFDDWPDQPVMLCPDPAVTKQAFHAESQGPCQALPVNSLPIPFESDLFRGVIVVYIRHLATTPPHLFKGKKRLNWVAIQGQFKRPVCMDSLVFGQEFTHKLCNLPAPWFIDNMLLPLARKISPALRVGNLEQPYLYSPLITASQIVHVAVPGSAPDIMDAKEDTSIVAPALGCKPGEAWSVASRRKHFQSASHRQRCQFTPEHVWTFHLWQEYVDFASYMLNLSYSSYDLAQHLDGQPLQVMVKDVSCSTYLVNMHVWHRNLVRNSPHLFNRQSTRTTRTSGHESAAANRSAHVTGGGAVAAAATDSQPCSPSEGLHSTTASEAGTYPPSQAAAAAVAAGVAKQLDPIMQQQQQQLIQSGSPAAVSAVGHPVRPEASSEVSEHWFDAWHSNAQQDSEQAVSSSAVQQHPGISSAVAANDPSRSVSLDSAQQRSRALQRLDPAAAAAGITSARAGVQQGLAVYTSSEVAARPGGSCNVSEAASPTGPTQLQTMRSL